MLDIKFIRENPKEVEAALKKRDPQIKLDRLLKLDKEWRRLLGEVEELRARRNRESEEIGKMKAKGADVSKRVEEMKEVGERIKSLDAKRAGLIGKIWIELQALPNIPHESVPVSQNKDDREVVREWGEKPQFGFEFKNHVELGKDLGILDFERAATIAGAQFPLYVGNGALLEWALIDFMFRHQVFANSYTPVIPPHLMSSQSAYVHTTLPKFADEVYRVEKDDLYLIPTAEASLVNMHRDEILEAAELPLKYTAYTPCYRREAGSYGAKERGLVRVHQFNKVETVRFVKPEESWQHLEEMCREAEEVVEALELHYRTTNLVTSDIAFGMAKTYDVEVWLPGQEDYYEVSSASNGTDFQARRANTRYRPAGGGKPEVVHILNASGLATSRLMVSILECNQLEDGSVRVPGVLQDLVGKEVISRPDRSK